MADYRNLQQAIASPDSDNSYSFGITPVYNPKWWIDEFPQNGLIEFGHDPPDIGMICQGRNSLKYLCYQSRPDLGYPLLHIPQLHLLKIAKCGFSETDDCPGHGLISTRGAP